MMSEEEVPSYNDMALRLCGEEVALLQLQNKTLNEGARANKTKIAFLTDTVNELDDRLNWTENYNEQLHKGMVDPIPAQHVVSLPDFKIDARNADGYTQLIRAVMRNQLPRVRQLLADGADPNATDKNGHAAVLYAAHMGRLPHVKALVARGADLTLEYQLSGDPPITATALSAAEQQGHGEVAEWIRARGVFR